MESGRRSQRVGESVSGFRWGERDDEKSSHLVLWDSFSSLAAKLAQLVRVASVQAAVKPRHHTAAPAVILSHLSQAFDSLLCLLSWATCTSLLSDYCMCVCVWVSSKGLYARVFACVCGKKRAWKGNLPFKSIPTSPAWCLRVLLKAVASKAEVWEIFSFLR